MELTNSQKLIITTKNKSLLVSASAGSGKTFVVVERIVDSIKAGKDIDFVEKTDNMIYAIETNFYTGGGSKLNETARSYKMLAQEADSVDGFTFVWFTDGIAWRSAKGNLRETFEVLDTIYSIDDIEQGVMKKLFV